MKNLSIHVFLAFALVLNAPSLAQSTKDAYLEIKKSAFKKQFQHLAVMPVVASPALGMPESFKQPILEAVVKKFSKAKYQLLPPIEAQKIRQQFVGLYPTEVTPEQEDIISEHATRELFFQHAVDGVVRIQIIPVAASFINDKAEWGGTTQKIKHKGDGILGAILGKKYAGTVAASAIQVLISDRQGKPVFNWIGGIEVLMQRNGQQLEQLPHSALWQNEKRVLKAAKYAVKPI